MTHYNGGRHRPPFLFNMKQQKFELSAFLYVILVITVTLFVYWPGLNGPFLFDDFPNLEPLGYFGGVTDFQSALSFVFGNSSGPTGRPVSMATFLLNDLAWPSSPHFFKYTNLMLHIVCGLLGGLVLIRLLISYEDCQRKTVVLSSISIVFLWLIHPINVSTVLYVVQRMAILSAIFSLSCIYIYLLGRVYLLKGKAGLAISLFSCSSLFLLLGIFSKENAILALPFLLILEIYWFDQSLLNDRLKRIIRGNIVSIGVVSVFLLFLTYDYWGGGYSRRSFDLLDRILLQVAALGDYIEKIFVPYVTKFNLFNGEFESASGFPLNKNTLTSSFLFLFFVLLFFMAVTKNRKEYILGFLWFFTFHAMESTILPLEIYFEHRNYLPSFGLVLVFVIFVRDVSATLFKSSLIYRASVPVFTVFLSISTLILTITWASADTLFLKWEMDEPKSVRAKIVYASLLEDRGFPENSMEHINDAMEIQESLLALKLRKLYLICRYGFEGNPRSILASVNSGYQFGYGVPTVIKMLIQLDEDEDGKICELGDGHISISEVFNISELAKFTDWNPKRAAQFYSLKSDYYASLGNLNQSVQSVEAAISYTPTVDLYLKAAVMLASAGVYEESLEMLNSAMKADSKRPSFYPSREPEIVAVIDRVTHLTDKLKN